LSATLFGGLGILDISGNLGISLWVLSDSRKKNWREQQAAKIVAEAHDIARKRGRNVMSIVKDLIAEIKK
jgi:hypothetical protein